MALTDPADIAALSALLDQALALATEDREAWLAALPAEQQRHVPALRGMLARHDSTRAGGFLAGGARAEFVDDSVAQAGEVVGAYRLLREIGRGGMGSVWLAERADGAFERQVALKLPRLAWGAGLAERMARERRIGALLEHPHIARLYDAGVDARGRPFIAMEYVEGVAIDVHVRQQALAVREVLQLMLQVIRAVAYAHGRLVVHRDLKPGNVLVSADGQAHLLDFGIAKLLDDEADPRLTQDQGRAMTLNYAAPEQLAGQAVGVQADVYAMGVLLYELLTGSLPHVVKRNTTGALEEAILQGHLAPASSRVKDKATARALRGEVDAMLAMALQPDLARRYATAEALAVDIERHLQGHPVKARRISAPSRWAKAARRNWVAVSAVAAVLLTMVAGSAVAVVQAQRAARAAEREQVVKTFVADVFRINTRNVTGDAALRRLPADMLLEHSAKLIRQRFAGKPDLQAELYGVVGGIFADMGASRLAVEYVTLQVEVLVTLHATEPEQAGALLTLAEALLDEGRVVDAELRARRGLQMLGSASAQQARGLTVLARSQIAAGRFDEAQRTLDQLEARMAADAAPPSRERAWALALRGEVLVRNNRLLDAYPVYLQAVAAALAADGPQSLTAAAIRLQAVSWYWQVADHERADALYLPAIATLKAAGGPHAIRAVVDRRAACGRRPGGATSLCRRKSRPWASTSRPCGPLAMRCRPACWPRSNWRAPTPASNGARWLRPGVTSTASRRWC